MAAEGFARAFYWLASHYGRGDSPESIQAEERNCLSSCQKVIDRLGRWRGLFARGAPHAIQFGDRAYPSAHDALYEVASWVAFSQLKGVSAPALEEILKPYAKDPGRWNALEVETKKELGRVLEWIEGRDARTVVDVPQAGEIPTRQPGIGDVPSGEMSEFTSECVFRRSGKGWSLRFNGEESSFGDLKGLAYLHCLITKRGTPVDVKELEKAIPSPTPLRSAVDEPSLNRETQDDSPPHQAPLSEPVLDDHAFENIQRSIEETTERVKDAKELRDIEQAEESQQQLERLVKFLASARGLGGRNKKMADDEEDRRNRVRKAIRTAMDKIQPSLPRLHAHLTESIEYLEGRSPCYQPKEGIPWMLS